MHPAGLNSNNHREEIMVEIILADIALEETERPEFRIKTGEYCCAHTWQLMLGQAYCCRTKTVRQARRKNTVFSNCIAFNLNDRRTAEKLPFTTWHRVKSSGVRITWFLQVL